MSYKCSDCSGLTTIKVENGNARFDSRNNSNAIIETESNTLIAGCMNTIIPNSVTSIGSFAFLGCQGLTSINIPNSVTSIGMWAFLGTKWYANQPDGLVYAGSVLYTYKGTMPANTKIEIRDGTKGIAATAFENSSSLTSITIPNSVVMIGERAFWNCSNLTSVTIGNSVTSIGSTAFRDCSCITSIIIPNSVTSIGEDAFSGCSGLISITIPESVTCIENYTFTNCSSLTSVTIGNAVTNIGEWAFFGCSNLTSITLPNSLTSIGMYAFRNCSGLTSIICEKNTPPNCDGLGSFYNVDKSIPVYVPSNSVKSYKIAKEWNNFTNIQAIPAISLTDGDIYTNESQLYGRDISYTRIFNNTKWQALYIPFSLSYDDWKDDFDVAYINGIRQIDTNDDNVIDETIMDVYKIEEGSLIPNTPYLIKSKTTGDKIISVNNATLYGAKENSIDCSTTISKYTFTGTYETIPASTLIENEYYAMGGGSVVMTDGESDLKPYRWYLKIEARNPIYNVANTPNAAKAITINVIDEESEATGISQVSQNDKLTSRIYDLNGRVVNENALKPGIYIKNGKKFVIK